MKLSLRLKIWFAPLLRLFSRATSALRQRTGGARANARGKRGRGKLRRFLQFAPLWLFYAVYLLARALRQRQKRGFFLSTERTLVHSALLWGASLTLFYAIEGINHQQSQALAQDGMTAIAHPVKARSSQADSRPTYQFHTPDGRAWTVQKTDYVRATSKLAVRYMPDDPSVNLSEATIASSDTTFSVPALLFTYFSSLTFIYFLGLVPLFFMRPVLQWIWRATAWRPPPQSAPPRG